MPINYSIYCIIINSKNCEKRFNWIQSRNRLIIQFKASCWCKTKLLQGSKTRFQ